MKKNTYPNPKQPLPSSIVPNVLDNKSTPGIVAWDVLAEHMRHDTALAQHIQNVRQYKALMEAKAKAMVGRCVSGFKLPQNTLAAPEMPEPYVNQNQ